MAVVCMENMGLAPFAAGVAVAKKLTLSLKYPV